MDARYLGRFGEENMKKKVNLFFLIFTSVFCFSQELKTDNEIKDYLLSNGFGEFKFKENGRWECTQYFNDVKESYGIYKIENGYIKFLTCDSYYSPSCGYQRNEIMSFPGKYKLCPSYAGLYNTGALINEDEAKNYWLDKRTEPYKQIIHNGIECIRYPWKNEGVENEYIVILENLKLRESPSLKAKVITIDGFDGEDVGFSFMERTIEPAGNICTIRAKTTKSDTIDGITAPWYLILSYGSGNGDTEDIKEAWVFGGYVKEIKSSEVENYKKKYEKTLQQSILKLNGHLKSQD